MDFPALKALIETHPDWPAIDDVQAAAWCNELALPGAVPVAELRRAVLFSGEFAALRLAADDPAHPGRAAAINAVELLRDREATVDYADPRELAALQAQTQALLDAGLIAAATKAALDGLGAGRVSRAAAAGLDRPIEPADITRLRT